MKILASQFVCLTANNNSIYVFIYICDQEPIGHISSSWDMLSLRDFTQKFQTLNLEFMISMIPMIAMISMISLISMILSVFSWFPFVGAYLRSFSGHFYLSSDIIPSTQKGQQSSVV